MCDVYEQPSEGRLFAALHFTLVTQLTAEYSDSPL
jgi:hypothetical protein